MAIRYLILASLVLAACEDLPGTDDPRTFGGHERGEGDAGAARCPIAGTWQVRIEIPEESCFSGGVSEHEMVLASVTQDSLTATIDGEATERAKFVGEACSVEIRYEIEGESPPFRQEWDLDLYIVFEDGAGAGQVDISYSLYEYGDLEDLCLADDLALTATRG